MEVNFQLAAAPKDVLAQKVFFARLPDGTLENLRAFDRLPANVDVSEFHVIRPAGDDHAFEELVRVLVDDLTVLERARLGLVRVANQVNRLAALSVHERPLQTAREPGAAATAQPGLEHFVADLLLR